MSTNPDQHAALVALAKRATNGWACYAKTNREHDEIARLHTAIDALAASPAGASSPNPHVVEADQFRADVDGLLGSHRYDHERMVTLRRILAERRVTREQVRAERLSAPADYEGHAWNRAIDAVLRLFDPEVPA